MAGVWVLTAMGDAHAHARKHAQTDGRARARTASTEQQKRLGAEPIVC